MKNYGGHFDSESKLVRIAELEEVMASSNFWDDKRTSEQVITELNDLRNLINTVSGLKQRILDNIELSNLMSTSKDEEILGLLYNDINEIDVALKANKVRILLDMPYDKENAIVDIHPGAGGTESCDWASMLSRMYTRYFEKKGYKYEIIDEQSGDEAGIKSISFLVKGNCAYGYLKAENGVHRLIRLSPFDSGNRRHTSFASVTVSPLFENMDIDIKIDDSDLRIDVYRSSGKGGQGVNTTDSAVRITHLPTKIVVTCQNERSQIQNKEKAMEVLKNRLYKLELEKKDKEISAIKGEYDDINFGSQIRTYTLHPYSLIKDHRTNMETSNVNKVLDGDLDNFINEYLVNIR